MLSRRPRHALRPVQTLDERILPAVLDFAVVTAQSTVTMSGNLAGFPFTPQGTGALTTTYNGIVRADIDLAANTISFLNNGVNFDANVTGNWQPAPGGSAGNAPADYGGAVVAVGMVFAIRDATSAFSTVTPIALTGTGSGRTFTSTQAVVLTGGTQDYNAGALGSGTGTLANTSTNNSATASGSFTDLGDGSARLTTPIVATYTNTIGGNPVTYTLTGTLQSLAPFPTVDPNGPAAGFDATANFAAGGPAVVLAPNLETRRLPAGNLTSATVTLAAAPNGNAESLTVALGSSGLTTSGYDPVTRTLTLNGSASLATYQAVLRTLTYANSATTPSIGARTVSLVVNDGTTDSLSHNVTVNVNPPPPRVASVVINAGQTNGGQRSRVTSVSVTFTTQVAFAGPLSSAFTLSRIGGGTIGGALISFSVVGGVTRVDLFNFTGAETESGSLADGIYRLTIDASLVTAGGQQLDGNGDGTGGDNYVQNGTAANGLFRLYGDFDGNGVTNAFDFGQFRPAFGLTQLGDPTNYALFAFFDFNNDGAINAFDFGQFRNRFGINLFP